jgi:ribonuclease HII
MNRQTEITMLKQYNDKCVIEYGVDEVARGCLLGRVYAAAVVWKHPSEHPDIADSPLDLPKAIVIRDSKTMSKAQRERADKWIREHAYAVSISYKDEVYIDAHNILQSAHDAMADAIRTVSFDIRSREKHDDNIVNHVLVDGNRFNPSEPLDIYHSCIVKGDNKYISIACAAIVAKVAHDDYITQLCKNHPILHTNYDLLNNMGYGTKKHMLGIQAHGISNLHRKSFSCCQNQKETIDII